MLNVKTSRQRSRSAQKPFSKWLADHVSVRSHHFQPAESCRAKRSVWLLSVFGMHCLQPQHSQNLHLRAWQLCGTSTWPTMYAGMMPGPTVQYCIDLQLLLDCIPIDGICRRIRIIALPYITFGSQCMIIQSSPGQGILTHTLRPSAAGQVGCICALQRGWTEAGHPAALSCRPNSAWHKKLRQL